MTSEERKEVRYWRRKRSREINKLLRSQENTKLDSIFSTQALIDSFHKSTKTNGWKSSIQKFKSKLAVNCSNISKELKLGAYTNKPYKKFSIVERGHVRNVQSLDVADLIVQGSFRDNFMHPIIRPTLIYDNGACLSGKGTSFALNRFVRHLSYHVRKYGTNGYVYFFDFKSFFKNINKDALTKRLQEVMFDARSLRYFKQFTYGYCEEGLSLGSSISQISAIFYPNKLDHYMKDQLRVKCYGRYMDDGYFITETKESLIMLKTLFEQKCYELGITLNNAKCKVVSLKRKFAFLKVRFFISKTGKIIRRPNKKSNVIERRRLRKFKKLVDQGVMHFKEALLYFHSWLCSRFWCKSFLSNKSMVEYFNALFSNYGYYYPLKVKTRRHKILKYIASRAR